MNMRTVRISMYMSAFVKFLVWDVIVASGIEVLHFVLCYLCTFEDLFRGSQHFSFGQKWKCVNNSQETAPLKENIRPVRILVLDGGGLRGCMTCEMLQSLEEASGCQLYELFDFVMGTSTGGLIALGIAKLKWSAQQLNEFYDTVAEDVFGGSPSDENDEDESIFEKFDKWTDELKNDLRFVGKIVAQDALLPTDRLEKIFQDRFHDRLMKRDDNVNSNEPYSAVLATRVDTSPQPFVFRSYDINGGPDLVDNVSSHISVKSSDGSSTAQIWQACRATSAAPFYFEPFSMKTENEQNGNNNMILVDGSLVQNDPSLAAYMECRELFPQRPLLLLSFGTGVLAEKTRSLPNNYIRMGLNTFSELFSAKEHSNRIALRNLLNEGENYFRFNAIVDHDNMANSDYMKSWRETGRKYIKQDHIAEKIQHLAQILKSYKDDQLLV